MMHAVNMKMIPLRARCAIAMIRRMENVNFQRIAQELVDEYGNNQLVAQQIGVPTSTVWRVVTGKIAKPSWILGDKLLRAHEQMRAARRAERA